MTNVSRADKKCVREMISSLESAPTLDFEKVTNIKKYLSVLGFSEDSEYVLRINSLEGKLNEREKIKNEEKRISEIPKLLRYSGVYLNQANQHIPIKLDFRYNHLFLSRNYKNNFENSAGLKVSWRFESDGKIYLIDALDIPSRNVTHILGPIKNSTGQYSWSRDMEFLFYTFPRLASFQKIDLLLKWGYNSTKELLNASLSNKVKDSTILRGEEVGLTSLYSNPFAMGILRNSSKLNPSFIVKERFGILEYN